MSATAAGYGFVRTAEGDFFVPASKMGGAFDGDMVEVAPLPRDPRRHSGGADRAGAAPSPAARVVRVLHRAHETVIGRYEVADPFGVVVPLDARIPSDIFTMRSDNPQVPDGALVRVRIVQFPSRHEAATGVVEEVFDAVAEGQIDGEMVIAAHRLETTFSDGALRQAALATVDVEGALTGGYADLRDRFVFTIDPDDARDFDDAVSLQPLEGDRWLLGVHIADVSHYVEWGSPIDLDARRRATSVYLVDRVLPMLPEALSNDVCSLAPGQPRRAFTMDAVVDGHGRIERERFYLSIIESHARLSYDLAQRLIDVARSGGTPAQAAIECRDCPLPAGASEIDDAACATLFAVLPQLDRIARQRRHARRGAGGIDFDTVEAKVRLDGDGRPTAVTLRERTDATSLVEEAMLMANECAARHLHAAQMPGIFRVHDAPSPDSMAQVVPVLQELGYMRDVSMERFVAGDPFAVQDVLALAQGRPEQHLVSQLVLRCMQRACYSSACLPHYALASQAYCHFTSPIRRYPDLVVHRMLKAVLQGTSPTHGQQVDSLGWLAEHSSAMEREAEDAARETQELKLVEYMARHVGETMSGLVVGVAPYGIYVQLGNTAEGLLPARGLGTEHFAYDAVLHKLTGQDSGTVYQLGQPLDVVIAAAPPHRRRLELRLPS
jgi:ribonuclease R